MSVVLSKSSASRAQGSVSQPVVLHVTTTDMSLELLLGPQLERFSKAGFRVVTASAPGPYVSALAQRNIEHVALHHTTRSVHPGHDALALAELVRLFRRLRPTIVHTHNPKPGIYGRVAARLARVPVIVNTVHGLYAQPDDSAVKRSLVYGLERFAATCSHAELVQNPEDLEVLRRLRVPAHKLSLLGNGVDLARFDPARITPSERMAARRELGAVDDSDVIVGAVGRLVIEKGYRELFAAAERLRTRAPSARFAVIGPDQPEKGRGALSRADRARAEAAGIRFLGERHDVERLYAGMDAFVLASYREGMPRAAMEAAAMGLPIVTTDVRGCRQVVADRHTGLLVPARDTDGLSAAIQVLADDPQLRARMGAAGRERALALFDQERCIELTLETYAELMARAGLPTIDAAVP